MVCTYLAELTVQNGLFELEQVNVVHTIEKITLRLLIELGKYTSKIGIDRGQVNR
jgi:hypothetical protein